MNILVVKLSAIGDVIHTLPAVNAIRDTYPDAHITWVVEEAASDLVMGHPSLDQVLVSRRKTWIKRLKGGPGRLKAIKEAVFFVKQLRGTVFDVVIDFQALLKSGMIVALAKGKRKIGFDRGMQHMEHSYLFLNERIPPVDMEIHALTRQFYLAEAIGAKSKRIEYHIPVTRTDRKQVDDLLKRKGVDPSIPLVAINPVALWDTKLWYNERFAELADVLIQEDKVQVVYTGGPGDQRMVSEIMDQMQQPAISVAGNTSLKMLAALYETAKVVVSTDTGPMHLAAAVDAPVVALFGPTAPWRTGPFGHKHQVVRAEAEYKPCFKRLCENQKCMKEITVKMVLSAVRKMLRAD